MSLRFRCIECSATVILPDHRADKKNYCPRCDARLPNRPVRSGAGPGLIIGLVVGSVLVGLLGIVGVGALFWYLMADAAPQPQPQVQANAGPIPEANGPVRHIDPLPAPDPNPGMPNDVIPDDPFAPLPQPMFPPREVPKVPGLAEVKKPKPAKPLKLPAIPARLPIKPAALTEVKEYKLPDSVERAIPAGGGRFVLFHLPSQRKVGVFDVNEARIVRFINIGEDKPLLTAGMHKLMVYLPRSGILQRYNLLTGEREASKVIDVPNVKGLAMGSASAGPLVIAATDGGRLFDVETLTEIELPQDEQPVQGPFGPPGFPGDMPPGPKRLPFQNDKVWASANGRMFVGQGHFDGAGIVFEGNHMKTIRAHRESWMYAQPSPDAKYIFRGGFGAVTRDGQQTRDVVHSDPGHNAFAGYFFLPAADGPFYFHIHFANGFRGQEERFQKDPLKGVTVYMYGLDSPIARVMSIKDMPDFRAIPQDGLPVNEMLHLIPRAKVLLTIGPSRDKLTITPLDLDQAMDEAGIDFLLVTSSPPGTFCPGHEFKYPIRVRSKAGSLKFTLDDGPQRMKIAQDGTVTWKVPAGFEEAEVNIIVGIKDAAGKEAFHSFRLLKSDKPEEYFPDPEPEPIKAPPKIDPKVEGPRAPYKLPAIPSAVEMETSVITRRTEVPIAAKYDRVIAAGGGRYLVLHAEAARKAFIFDVATTSVARSIDLGDDKAVVAAGMTQLLVYRPSTTEIEKYDLATGASIGKRATGIPGVTDMVMGSASAGPLFVRAGERAELFDVDSLRAMDIPRDSIFPFQRGPVSASANGRVFGNTANRATGSFVQLALLGESTVRTRSELVSAPYVAPSADGKAIYVGGFGEMSTKFKDPNSYSRSFEEGSDKSYQLIPASSPDYFLMLHVGASAPPSLATGNSTTKGVTIWHRELRRAAAVLGDMPELPAELSGSASLPSLVHYMSDAQLLVAASPSRDRLVVYPVKLSGVPLPQKKSIAWRIPDVVPPPAIKAYVPKERTTVNFPSRIEKVVAGGAGRYLIHKVELRKLLVFDVTVGKVTREVVSEEPIVSYAAGRDKLVLAQQGTMGYTLRKFDLANGNAEAVAGVPNDHLVLQMGSASAGPLYVVGSTGVRVYDLATLAPLNVPGNILNDLKMDRDRIAVSADGRTLVSAPRASAARTRPIVLQFTKDGVKKSEMDCGPVSAVTASPDGEHIFLSGAGIFTRELKKNANVVWSPENISPTSSSALIFAPAAEGPYYLHLHFGTRHSDMKFAGDPLYGLTVYKYGKQKAIGQLPKIVGETRLSYDWVHSLKPTDMYHFLPSSKLLITVDPAMTKLHLIPVDPENIPPAAEPEPIKPKPKTPSPMPKATVSDPGKPAKPKSKTTRPERPLADAPANPGKPFRLTPLPEPLAIKPLEAAKTFTFTTPSRLSPVRVRLAGGGRFLLVQRDSHKIDIFDLNEAKVVHTIEFTERPSAWVAGMSKLFALDKDQRTIRRYDLLTGKEDLSKTYGHWISLAAMGSATDGPILCREARSLRFVHGETLEPMDLSAPELEITDYHNKTFWASPDGRTFGVGFGGMIVAGPVAQRAGTITLRLGADSVQKATGDFPSPYVVPDPTGRYMFAGGHGIYDVELKKTSDVVRSEDPSPREPPIHIYLPANDGPFYFRYHVANFPAGPGGPAGPGFPPPPRAGIPGGPGRRGHEEAELSIYAYGQPKPIAQIKVPDPINMFHPMHLSRMPDLLHVIPSAKAIVAIPVRGDKIHLIPFDAAAEMTKSGVEVPWVISTPPRSFKPGDEVSYALKLHGKVDGVKSTLEEPTPGMSIGADGSFTWKAPADAPAEVRVRIRVKNANGEGMHSFVLTRE